MAQGKKSFILYSDHKELFESLDDKRCAQLIRHIFKYVNDENPKLSDPTLKIVWTMIEPILKRDLKNWEGTRTKRVDSGKLGGIKSGEVRRKKKEDEANEAIALKSKQKEANEAVNVNGSVSVNDSDNEKKITLHTSLKCDFIDYVKHLKEIDYYWAAKDAAALKKIIAKLKDSISKKEGIDKKEISDEKIQVAFRYMLENINDPWTLDNFSMTIINSKYNEIIAKIKNNGKGTRKKNWLDRNLESED